MNAGGLVEMHAHILPGMDDGSKSVEMSIEMLHRLAEMGVAEVCATSHYYAGQNSVTMYLERRAMALEQLREAVGAQDDRPASSQLPRSPTSGAWKSITRSGSASRTPGP